MDIDYTALWIEHIRPLLVPLATLVGALVAARITWHFGSIQAGIAKQQARTAAVAAETARNKLKLELFEKRLAIYEKVRMYVTSEMSADRRWSYRTDHEQSFLQEIAAARWLFGPEVMNFIQKTLLVGLDSLRVVRTGYDEMVRWADDTPEAVRKEITARKLADAHANAAGLLLRLDEVFAPYLELRH